MREAAGLFEQAAALAGGDPVATHLSARARLILGQKARAEGLLRAALGLHPDNAILSSALGTCLLRQGRLAEATPLVAPVIEEWSAPWRKRLSLPALWSGGALDPGSRVLVISDGGFGDLFQNLRFLPALRARGTEPTLAVPDRVVNLIAGTALAGVRVTGLSALDGPYDCTMSLSTLPFRLKISGWDGLSACSPTNDTLLSVPSGPPPEPGGTEAGLIDRVRRHTGPRIGLVWSGAQGQAETPGPNGRPDPFTARPTRLADWAGLAAVPDVLVVSLQGGPKAAEALSPPPGLTLCGTPADGLPEHGLPYPAAAHLLPHLDLLLTIDTGMMHLAGALGCPVWGRLPVHPDWRWDAPGNGATLWYPSLRLVRDRPADSAKGIPARNAVDVLVSAVATGIPPAGDPDEAPIR